MSKLPTVIQKGVAAGNDVIGANKFEVSNLTINIPPIVTPNPPPVVPGYLLINKLVDELRAAIKDDEEAKRTVDNLQIYKRDGQTGDGVVGLEGKLKVVGRGGELEGALDQKQLFVELLEKWSYYASAQEIFAHLLARMRRCFNTKILPYIPDSAASDIDALVDSEVVEPILDECSQIPQFTVNSDVALGMYYWLADQCYVRWHS